MEVVVRKASQADLDLVVQQRLEFLRSVGDHDVVADPEFVEATRQFVEEEIVADRLHSWLAETDESCIGVVSMLLWPRPPRPNDRGTRDAYIINMHVAEASRGAGVGRRLLSACLASADEFGIGKFLLHATDAGRPLYESSGFVENPRWLERPGGPLDPGSTTMR